MGAEFHLQRWAAAAGFFLLVCLFIPGAAKAAPEKAFNIQIRNYFHLRYHWDFKENETEGDWALRRFKLKCDADYHKDLKVKAQLIYKTNNNSRTDDGIYLQHAYVEYRFAKGLTLKSGQFKPPFGWERFQRDFIMPCIERTQAIDRLIPNGSEGTSFSRDYGVQFSGQLKSLPLSYELAVMTGNGANAPLTTDNAPLIVGRLTYQREVTVSSSRKPLRLQIQVAQASRWDGNMDFSHQLPGADVYFQHFSGTDRRWDVAGSVGSDATRLAVEALYARFNPSDPERSVLEAYGYFVQLEHRQWSKLEGVIRYERFDPNVKVTDTKDLQRWTLGLNYSFDSRGDRLMLGYIHNDEGTDEVRNDQIILQLQMFLVGGFQS